MYLEDIGIKGSNQIKVNDGCGYFNGLKFSSTSYNNEGVKFHLLIVVFKNEQKSDLLSNIICSVISPPIFVDSRKSARNYQVSVFYWFRKKSICHLLSYSTLMICKSCLQKSRLNNWLKKKRLFQITTRGFLIIWLLQTFVIKSSILCFLL